MICVPNKSFPFISCSLLVTTFSVRATACIVGWAGFVFIFIPNLAIMYCCQPECTCKSGGGGGGEYGGDRGGVGGGEYGRDRGGGRGGGGGCGGD